MSLKNETIQSLYVIALNEINANIIWVLNVEIKTEKDSSRQKSQWDSISTPSSHWLQMYTWFHCLRAKDTHALFANFYCTCVRFELNLIFSFIQDRNFRNLDRS